MSSHPDEIDRLRQAFEALPKVPGDGESALRRHANIRPECVMRILAEPYGRFEEWQAGEMRAIIVGRVPESRSWIKVVFVGYPETGVLLTAYNDSRLEGKYG